MKSFFLNDLETFSSSLFQFFVLSHCKRTTTTYLLKSLMAHPSRCWYSRPWKSQQPSYKRVISSYEGVTKRNDENDHLVIKIRDGKKKLFLFVKLNYNYNWNKRTVILNKNKTKKFSKNKKAEAITLVHKNKQSLVYCVFFYIWT